MENFIFHVVVYCSFCAFCCLFQKDSPIFYFSDMLKLGKSKHWQDALEMFTGSRMLSVDPIEEYFRPLFTYLKEERAKKGYSLGWNGMSNPKGAANNASLKSYLLLLCLFLTQLHQILLIKS